LIPKLCITKKNVYQNSEQVTDLSDYQNIEAGKEKKE